jgi:hypothetical protein
MMFYKEQKKKIDELRITWKRLWQERRDDKIRAEGIAVNDYDQLFIDQGTVIRATRDFKSISFKEVLIQHNISVIDQQTTLNPKVGGWGKFIRDNFSKPTAFGNEKKSKKKITQQSKHRSRGWLHA